MKQTRLVLGVALVLALTCASAMALPTVRIEGPSAVQAAGGGSFDVNIYVSNFDKGPMVFEGGVPVGYEWDNRMTGFLTELQFTGGASAEFHLAEQPGGFGYIDGQFDLYPKGRQVSLGSQLPSGAMPLVGELTDEYFGAVWMSGSVETTDEVLLATATITYDANASGVYDIGFLMPADPVGDPLFSRGDENNAYIEFQAVNGSVEIEAVPEPATLVLLSSGLLGLVAYRRRK